MCDLFGVVRCCWSAVRARDRCCCCCCCWPTVNSRQKSWSSEAEWKLKLWLPDCYFSEEGCPVSAVARSRLLQTSSMSCQWSSRRRRRRKKTLATTVINSGELNWTLNWTLNLLVSQCKCVYVHFCHSLLRFRLLRTHFRLFSECLKSSADWLISCLNLLWFSACVLVFTFWTVPANSFADELAENTAMFKSLGPLGRKRRGTTKCYNSIDTLVALAF